MSFEEVTQAYGDWIHTLAAWQIFAHVTYRDRTPATWRLLPPQVQSRRRPRPKRAFPPVASGGPYVGPGFVLATWGDVMGQLQFLSGRRPEWVLGMEAHDARPRVLHAHAIVVVPGRWSERELAWFREAMWRECFKRCGRSLIEPYAGLHAAHYAAKYVAKGGQLAISSGLRPMSGQGGATLGLV